MKPGVPWSIKGVEPGLREAAKSAARRSGMTLGEWLNSAINEQAESYDDTPEETPRGRTMTGSKRFDGAQPPHPIERAASKLEDIAEKLSRLPFVETAGAYNANAQVDSQVNFAKILSRVDSHERQTVEAFSAVNERLANISKQVTRHQPPPVPKFEETPSYQALEKAVRNIIEHLDVSDKRIRENMKTLQDQMSSRLSGTGSDQMLRQAPAFSQLETRLTELARKLDQPVQNPGDQLRGEIEQLANRIDTVRESSEQLASRAQTQAVQTAQSELRAIEGRLIGLLNEAKQSILANHVGPAELQRFRGEIDKLNSRIDDAAKNAATDRDVSALKVAVEQLTSRVTAGGDSKPLAELDRRIIEIAQKLERAEQQGLGGSMASEVERRFAELDQRLSQGHAPAGDNPKLREMDERLARTEQQLTHLDTIERAIAQLYEAFEESRKAPQAAYAANAEGIDLPPASVSGSPEIVALENGLKAVREAAENADTRNQETLEAVHETLEQIVSKLAELETAAIGQRVGAAVAPQAAAALDNPFERPEEKLGRNPFADEEPEVKLELEKPAKTEGEASNPFETEAAATSSPAGGISDLIAAARRLHQANNAQPSQLSSIVPGRGNKTAAKTSKGFTLPFMGGGDKAKSAKPAGKAGALKAANSNEGGKRRLVVLGLLLLAVATFATTNMLSRVHTQQNAKPVAIEQQATPPVSNEAPMVDSQAGQTSQIPAPSGQVPSLAAPDQGVPPLPEPAPMVQGQQSDASDQMLQIDPITTGAISPATKKGVDINATATAALDAAVGPQKLREAATAGDNTAQFIVATHYLNGDTTGQDYNKAAYWYGKAATAGLAPAQYRLATLYERGTGVDKNLSTALAWYEKAGTMGNVKAMHNAAVLAAGTDAGGPDYNKAFKWFSLAAAHGLKDSEFNLAVLMERGLGTKQDVNEALFWYMAAASQDDVDAKARVKVLSKSMSPTIVDAVKQRFTTWVPTKAPDAANVVAVNDAQWNPAPAKASANKQSMNDNPNDAAKKLLDQLGYRVGTLDGALDAKTSNAIKLFQIREGMKATGKVTPDLLSAMQDRVG
ncbi:peptidoglycan-binding protein [Aestuariivirga litoralis]|uniref:peptidoglycan-binding protein n=1 Tax=Aestuariivirga litoralis TaxID=2650924 RepID=UPI0018C79C79|nr:peptidoglycan-binding protein [Aestuariivirga litoralis]MBG1232853.1 hypothetical protein [Aestuariivirga litoralis]